MNANNLNSNNRKDKSDRTWIEHFLLPIVATVIAGIILLPITDIYGVIIEKFAYKPNVEQSPEPPKETSPADDNIPYKSDFSTQKEIEPVVSTVSDEISNAPQFRITYDTTNYFGSVELSSDVACAGELVTIIVDTCQFHSIFVADEYGNPLDICMPSVTPGNIIPFSFIMPEGDAVITIEGESN